MLDFIFGDGGHGFDPVFGWDGVGPAVEKFEGV
jgi:hypothetical protein